ncbi:restriction system protein [Kitasatospora sp. GP30]|uniref:restriction endonuclease n=1 Tax=Kitasatospora sp. GP30 TaxID=3035084 RepID=UPI00117FF715|nr:restriction endonuclease [Kitasatospora sp. GP30]MDH6138537.1 restriction system protein [Kitasatospora sp. GP30]
MLIQNNVLPAQRRRSGPILRPDSVRPVRYRDADLRGRIGTLVGHASDDTLLAGFLWIAEGQAAREALDSMDLWKEWLDSAIQTCMDWLADDRQLSEVAQCVVEEIDRLRRADVRAYADALTTVRSAQAAAQRAFEELRDQFGAAPTTEFGAGSGRDSPAELVFAEWDQAVQAGWEAEARWRVSEQKFRRLKVVGRRRHAFAASPDSYPADALAQLNGTTIEQLTAQLLARDGLAVIRAAGGSGDQGADVIAETSDGRRLVFQCKYRQRGAVGPKIIYETNGTARQIHRADVAVVITNAVFSAQAAADARSQGIHLIDGHGLRCWATWGDSIYDVLAVPAPEVPSPS